MGFIWHKEEYHLLKSYHFPRDILQLVDVSHSEYMCNYLPRHSYADISQVFTTDKWAGLILSLPFLPSFSLFSCVFPSLSLTLALFNLNDMPSTVFRFPSVLHKFAFSVLSHTFNTISLRPYPFAFSSSLCSPKISDFTRNLLYGNHHHREWELPFTYCNSMCNFIDWIYEIFFYPEKAR